MTQLRAQSRIRTGFPIEPAGKIPGMGTIVRCKNTKKRGFYQYLNGFLARYEL